jgi:UDP-glucose 4-epimerase
MKVLVTGGAGFIGSHLVEKLVERGDTVTVLDDFSAGKIENLKKIMYKINIVYGSVCDSKLVFELVSKTDFIFHLATQCLVKGLEDPQLEHDINTNGTFNICSAAKHYHTKHFQKKIVYVGTSEEYGPQQTFPIKEDAPTNPVSIYGLTKLIAEQYVRFFNKIYDVPAVIIRPFNTFGPRQREDAYAGVITSFLKRLINHNDPLIFGDGLQKRDFTYVTDIVNGILLLSNLENGEIINIGSGKETSILDLANTMIKTYVDSLRKNMPPYGFQPIFDTPRPNDLKRLCADISLAKSYGYKPTVSLEEGLKKYVEWYKSARHGK